MEIIIVISAIIITTIFAIGADRAADKHVRKMTQKGRMYR